MANETIKRAAKEFHVKLWRIADRMGLSDSSFSRMLRKELSKEDRNKILFIIADLVSEDAKGSLVRSPNDENGDDADE